MSDIACPVCGVEPGHPCVSTTGRPVKEHLARSRRATRTSSTPKAPMAASAPRMDTVVIEAFDRRKALAEELAKVRSRCEQLRFVIDYLEGELA